MSKKLKENNKEQEKASFEELSESADQNEDVYEFAPKKDRRRLIKIISIPVLAALLAATVFIALKYFPAGGSAAYSPVRINEIMTTSDACPNADGVFCDYIELYNDSDKDVDISGFTLTDNELSPGLVFGEDTIVPANGYLVVSCDGSKALRGDKALYASFSLSRSGGEKIVLKNSFLQTVSSVKTSSLKKNEALIFAEEEDWETFFAGTPGFENSAEGRDAYIDSLDEKNGLVISEIMAKNLSGPVSNDGERYDWIELANTSEKQIDLEGYRISDDPLSLAGSVLPAYTLEAGECVLIYASGLSEYPDGEIHTEFSLSGDGETLIVLNASGRIVCALEYPELPDNHSYMLVDGEYTVSAYCTPGAKQTQPEENEYEGVFISELMPVNTAGIADFRGEFSDWIEITNTSAVDISLADCWLTTDTDNLFFRRLPEVTVKAGESILVFASGREEGEGDEIHVDFKLTSNNGILALVSPTGCIIDAVTYETSRPDCSLVREGDDLKGTAFSSPGFGNGPEGYVAYQETLDCDSPLIISEVMTANDSVLAQPYGRYYDWVEIKNTGAAALKLSEYYLSDDSDNSKMWQMPDITLEPDECVVFLCSGDETLSGSKYTHTNFSLNAEYETLFVFDDDGNMLDRLLLFDIPPGASAGRMDGQNGLFLFSEPSPKKKNTDGVRAVTDSPYSLRLRGFMKRKN